MNLIAVSLAVLFVSAPAFAHRGAESIVQEEHPGTEISKIPGFFDSGVVPKGRFVLEVPTTTLDYGLTENLTVGTMLLNPAISALSSFAVIAGHAKARYRFFSNRNFALAGTAYLGAFWLPGGLEIDTTKIDSMSVTYQTGTVNLSYSLKPNTEFLFHFGALRAAVSAENEALRYSEQLDASFLMAGPGIQHFFNERFGIDAILPIPFYSLVNADSSQASATLTGALAPGSLIPLRVMAHLRVGQESFVSFGVTAIYYQRSLMRLPLFTWAWVL